MKKSNYILMHVFFIAVCSIIGYFYINQLQAYYVKKEEINKYFLQQPEYPLAKAVITKNYGKIKRLCKKNPEWIKRSFEEEYYSVLHYAVSEGETNAVKALLKAGMNPNVVNPGGNTPIFTAVDQLYEMVNKVDYSKIVRLLIDYGADCNIHLKRGFNRSDIGNGGETPLILSICHSIYLDDSNTIPKLLIEDGHADVNDRTEYGVTAAVAALWFSNLKIAHYLIKECKADVTEPFYFCYENDELNKIQIYPVMLVKELNNFPEDSENHKLMQEIIAEFKNQGIEDFESPIPDDVQKILEEHCPALYFSTLYESFKNLLK